ncbi:lysophospholipase L1-like esterase [Maribacter sp. MAR_2009_72]|nr:lysophospholipase L1-like esterase [Maribacter sp. MAR_2009_72]
MISLPINSKKRIVAFITAVVSFVANGQIKDMPTNFVFGTHNANTEYAVVDSSQPYTEQLGYGFDFNTSKNVQFHHNGFSIDKAPVYFSVMKPEGNYMVKIDFEGAESATTIILKAESRRLMLDTIIGPNTTFSKSVMINVRTPNIIGGGEISLKDRELTYLNWDRKLTLEFLGTAKVRAIQVTPIPKITSIFLAGDSTVTDQDLEPWASWGQFITRYLSDRVVVSNYAYSGASLSSFKGSRRLEKIGSLLKKGDYLLIEFGHNDQKQKEENEGPWLNYTKLLVEFVNTAREKGAIPVLLTPVQRRSFGEDGKLNNTHGEYPDAVRAVAKKMNVPLIDLTKITTTLYESWGDDRSRKAFVQYPANTFPGQSTALEDNTHFNAFGANEIAFCVIQEIKRQGLPLEVFLKNTTPAYNPAFPNHISQWALPLSNRFEPTKPDGN